MYRPTESKPPRPPESSEHVVTSGPPFRLLVLNEALGIPLPDLEAKSGSEIREILSRFGPRGLDHAVEKVLQRTRPDTPPEDTPEGPQPLNLPASQAELEYRIDQAYQFLYKRYAYHVYIGGPYDFEKEYPGFPVGIIKPTPPTEQMTGQEGVASVTCTGIGKDYCFLDVDFDMGVLCWADRIYYIYKGETGYHLTPRSYSGNESGVDLYRCGAGGEAILALADLKNQQLPKEVYWAEFWGSGCPSARYTIRHASQVSSLCWDAKGDGARAYWMAKLGSDFGFVSDLYYPMFGVQYPFDRWCFDAAAYNDCGTIGQQPEKLGGSYQGFYYPYHSKVCVYRGSCNLLGSYVWLSQRDRLVRALQAIHMLLKYNNPDYSYLDPKDDYSYTTPREIARDLEQNCSAGGPDVGNAYGINVWGQDADFASGVRTNAFMVLETLLGYKYGDAISVAWADRMADVLIGVQWGSSPFYNYRGESAEHGELIRPPYRGGQLLGWKPGSAYQWATPPDSWLRDIMDWFGMPSEEEDLVPSNLESTATYLQALRVYLNYRYQVQYPTGNRLP